MGDESSILVDVIGAACDDRLARALSFLSFLFRNLGGSKSLVENAYTCMIKRA